MNSNWKNTKTKAFGDVSSFYNHYMEKHARDSGVLLRSTPQSETASLIVVDMQNDFIYLPKPVIELFGLNMPIGRFCVESGLNIIQPMVEFIDRNESKLSKIIYTRDAHPKDHCSFFNEQFKGGPFPPHCIANHYGAALHPSIRDIAKKYPEKSAVIFKGCNTQTDSFGGEKYPMNDYMRKRQVGSCCEGLSDEDCMKNTGGRYLRDDLQANAAEDYPFASIPQYTDNSKDPLFPGECPESTFENMNKDLGAEFKISDLLAGQTSGTHTVYVVGLAADMCVKDTAVNIMKHVKKAGGSVNGVKINVVVIQDLTRYVFLPIQLVRPGGVYKNAGRANYFTNSGASERQLANVRNFKTAMADKDVNRYIFQYVEGGVKRLTEQEVKEADLSGLGSLDHTKNPKNYAAFTSPIKDIIADYKNNDVKLIMTLPTLNVLKNSGLSNIGNVFGTNNVQKTDSGNTMPSNGMEGGRRKNKTRKMNKKSCWPKMKGGKKTRKPAGHKKGCKCVVCRR